MRNMKLIFIAIIAVLMTSCATTSFYYQVYKATPSDKLITKENFLIYEDENCKVSYNLWKEDGNIGFSFYNKTDKNIFLNLEESFFILNGIAYDYYRNRVFTNSTSSGATTSRAATASKSVTGINYLDLLQTNRIQTTSSVGLITSAGYSISYNEEKVICIPSKTSKIITEYNINGSLYRDCDLFKYPTKKQIKSKSFSKAESPIVFSNRIAYTVGQSDNLIKFENEFYVSEISNYPEREITELRQEEFCGKKSTTKTKYFKDVSPNKFYIKYTKGQDTWKH
jgi:hypothetical protein